MISLVSPLLTPAFVSTVQTRLEPFMAAKTTLDVQMANANSSFMRQPLDSRGRYRVFQIGAGGTHEKWERGFALGLVFWKPSRPQIAVIPAKRAFISERLFLLGERGLLPRVVDRMELWTASAMYQYEGNGHLKAGSDELYNFERLAFLEPFEFPTPVGQQSAPGKAARGRRSKTQRAAKKGESI